MQNKLNNLKIEALELIKKAKTNDELFEIEKKYLWRKWWELNEILKWLSSLSKEEKPMIWKLSNEIKSEILNSIADKWLEIEDFYFKSLAEKEFIDVSQPWIWRKKIGSRHSISKFIADSISVFNRMWFDLVQWNEAESEWYNFTALNLWPDHPAREMQDTFFLDDLKAEKNPKAWDDRDEWMVLRTQTSSQQIHYMEKFWAPCAIISPWKVFRKDSDATHSPMFHQIEWLFINKKVSIAHLKYVLLTAFREILEDDKLDMRFRLSYFPFTEPSFEVDVSCPICGWKEKTCKVCKWNNWLEVWWAWMSHPDVLRNWWVDPEEFNWFAFWFWIDRLAMIKHKINDIRLFYENDLRFIKQF